MTGLRFSMIGKGFLSTFAFLLSSAMVLWAAPANAADPAVYGALPDVAEVQISPDGKTIAALRNIEGDAAVFFYDLENPQAPPTGLNVGSTNARDLIWADNEQVLLWASLSERAETSSGMETMEFFRWIAIPKSTLKPKVLFGNEPGYFVLEAGDLLATLPHDSKKAVFSRTTLKDRTRGAIRSVARLERITPDLSYGLLSANLKTGKQSVIDTGEIGTRSWIVNAEGESVARVDFNRAEGVRELHVANEKGRFSLLKSFPARPDGAAEVSFIGLGEKPDTLIGISYERSDTGAVVEVDLSTGEIGATLFSHPDYNIDSLTYDYHTATVTGARSIDDLPQTYYFSEDDRKLQTMLREALPGAAPTIISRSEDGARMIVHVRYTDHPTQFFYYDKRAQHLSLFDTSLKKLEGQVVAAKEKYDYVASDGLTIPGYLTVPKGASKQSMPLIVLPHGGPELRDTQSFGWWSFFYAARGYLVYEPNFRGSEGYGLVFRNAGYGEWGRRMQDDITEGVRRLIADGVVDPERICIVGASYGGYAALVGAAVTPELYDCAVSVNGMTDLIAFLAKGDISERSLQGRFESTYTDYWSLRIGDRFQNEDEIKAVSPIHLAGRIQIPIMLIHSRDDTVVPAGQSKVMRDRLKSAGKPHEYVELPGEDHWLSTSAMRTEMLRRSIEFIDAHIGE